MALAASDASDRADQLITLTERLTRLVSAQAQAFEAHRPQEVAGSLEETARLANLYRHECARIHADPALLQGAPPTLRTRLTQATEAFDTVLARQGRAIEAAKTVTEGLVRAIADEVASQREQSATYGASGQRAAAATTAITLNRQA